MKSSTKLLALGIIGALGILAAVGVARAKQIAPTPTLPEEPPSGIIPMPPLPICKEGSEKREVCLNSNSLDYKKSRVTHKCVNNQWIKVPPPSRSWCWTSSEECTEGAIKEKTCLVKGSFDYGESRVAEKCVNGKWVQQPIPISWCWDVPLPGGITYHDATCSYCGAKLRYETQALPREYIKKLACPICGKYISEGISIKLIEPGKEYHILPLY